MKEYNGTLIFCAVLLFCAVIISPAFADMKEVDEAELSKTKASVTGTPVKNINCVEKDGGCQEMKQDYVTFDKGASVSSPLESKVSDGFRFKASPTETWTYNFGANNPNYFGSSTTVVK